jgi:hypothetical protein
MGYVLLLIAVVGLVYWLAIPDYGEGLKDLDDRDA